MPCRHCRFSLTLFAYAPDILIIAAAVAMPCLCRRYFSLLCHFSLRFAAYAAATNAAITFAFITLCRHDFFFRRRRSAAIISIR